MQTDIVNSNTIPFIQTTEYCGQVTQVLYFDYGSPSVSLIPMSWFTHKMSTHRQLTCTYIIKGNMPVSRCLHMYTYMRERNKYRVEVSVQNIVSKKFIWTNHVLIWVNLLSYFRWFHWLRACQINSNKWSFLNIYIFIYLNNIRRH